MDRKLLKDWLIKGCVITNIRIEDHQLNKLLDFADLVLETNKTMNLTRITSMEEFAIKHFVDCLLLSQIEVDFQGKGIDIGTGAGFPGIVLACHYPESKITLVDSLAKRINFLNSVKEELALSTISTIHGRAEDLAHDPKHRQVYDWATARAVASLPVLIEYCAPFVKVGGNFIAMKAGDVESELTESSYAMKRLGLGLVSVKHFILPFDMGERTIIIFHKNSKVPKEYPRKAGIPNKKPLKGQG